MNSRIKKRIQLDQSLRKSRTTYILLSIIFFPVGVTGAFLVLVGLFEGGRSFVGVVAMVVPGIALAYIEYAFVTNIFEASRRMRVLRDDPSKIVRPMPVPFLSSLIGWDV